MKKRGKNAVPLRRKAKVPTPKPRPQGTVRIQWAPRNVRAEASPFASTASSPYPATYPPSSAVAMGKVSTPSDRPSTGSLDWLTALLIGSPSLNAFSEAVANGWITLGDGSTNPGQRVYLDESGGFRPGGPGSAPTGYAPKDREDGDFKPIQKETPPPAAPVAPPEPPTPKYGSELHDTVINGIHRSIDKQTHLTDEKKHEYKQSIVRVVSAMPSRAVELLGNGVERMRWHADEKGVTQSLVDRGHTLKPGQVVGGYYNLKEKSVTLDGGTAKFGGTTGTHAHELTHGIDAGKRFSGSQDWRQIHAKEIVGESGGRKLSNYAKTQPAESFAEFGRLLYATNASKAKVREKFPEAYGFFKKHGLVNDD